MCPQKILQLGRNGFAPIWSKFCKNTQIFKKTLKKRKHTRFVLNRFKKYIFHDIIFLVDDLIWIRVSVAPKFHCELAEIEMVWADIKRETRANCTFNIAGLRNHVAIAINNIAYQKVLNYTRRCQEYIRLYHEGCTTEEIDNKYAITKKSHRQPLKVAHVDFLASSRLPLLEQ